MGLCVVGESVLGRKVGTCVGTLDAGAKVGTANGGIAGGKVTGGIVTGGIVTGATVGD